MVNAVIRCENGVSWAPRDPPGLTGQPHADQEPYNAKQHHCEQGYRNLLAATPNGPLWISVAHPATVVLLLRQQLDIPVEIVAPTLVQVVRRKRAAMLLQLPAGRPNRVALDVHVRFARRAPALSK